MARPITRPAEPPIARLQATRNALTSRCRARAPLSHSSMNDAHTSDGAGRICSGTHWRAGAVHHRANSRAGSTRPTASTTAPRDVAPATRVAQAAQSMAGRRTGASAYPSGASTEILMTAFSRGIARAHGRPRAVVASAQGCHRRSGRGLGLAACVVLRPVVLELQFLQRVVQVLRFDPPVERDVAANELELLD